MKLFGCSGADAPSGHSAEPEPCCTVSAVPESVPNALSPARLLAKSLTSCETRDEWAREYKIGYGLGYSWHYRNEKRDMSIYWSCSFGLYSGSHDSLSTPFTLTKAEERIVREALQAFNRRERDEKEAAALHRLTAQAGDARSDETPKSGSARRASTRSRKGCAQ